MKLIFVVLISLIFVNGCIDDTVAEDPETPEFEQPGWIAFESFTGSLQFINMNTVRVLDYQLSNGAPMRMYFCNVKFNWVSGEKAQYLELGEVDSYGQCGNLFETWVAQKFPAMPVIGVPTER